MKLLTTELEKALPPLRSTEETPLEEKQVVVKFFSPYSNWTWYVVEGERREDGDFIFWGLVDGFEQEWGSFALSELENARGMGGALPLVERDLHFTPKPIRDVVTRA